MIPEHWYIYRSALMIKHVSYEIKVHVKLYIVYLYIDMSEREMV